MKKIAIIILSYKNEPALKKCLKSVYLSKVTKGWEKEIIIIDNNKTNLGFAAGCNVGIRRALKKNAHAILLLNQDTVVEENFLIPLLANPADIVAPVIKFRRKGKWVYDFGGKVNRWIGRPYHIELKSYSVNGLTGYELDYVSGCVLMIRRPVFEKIGLLDERYFLYFEDADFCLRAKKAGFKIAVEPKSLIIHQLVEGEKKPLRQRVQLLKSNLIFINRWIVWWQRPIAWLYWFCLCLKIFL